MIRVSSRRPTSWELTAFKAIAETNADSGTGDIHRGVETGREY
jgi:hypothetical protein